MRYNVAIDELTQAYPCEGCQHFERCRDEEIACKEYRVWVTGNLHNVRTIKKSGTARMPNKNWMDKVFVEEEDNYDCETQ